MESGNARTMQVTIVAVRSETLDGLKWYFSRRGLSARATRRLADADHEPCTAIVLFPDEFPFDDVQRALHRFRRDRPDLLMVLVTSALERHAAIAVDAESLTIIIPKPAWGWLILEAIRAGIEAKSDSTVDPDVRNG
jgi:hypothetical protein